MYEARRQEKVLLEQETIQTQQQLNFQQQQMQHLQAVQQAQQQQPQQVLPPAMHNMFAAIGHVGEDELTDEEMSGSELECAQANTKAGDVQPFKKRIKKSEKKEKARQKLLKVGKAGKAAGAASGI